MKQFALTKQASGRIVLTPDLLTRDEVIRTISAKNWVAARAKVNEAPFWNTQGEGWFER